MQLLKREIKTNSFYVSLFVLFIIMSTKLEALTVTESGMVSVSAIVGNEIVTVSPGGGSIVLPPNKSGVGFSGYAYPRGRVVLLKNSVFIESVIADETGFFSLSTAEPYNSAHIYTLYADDINQERSLLLNYPLVLSTATFTQISNILFAPTVVTDKIESQASESVIIEGYARPQKTIIVTIKENSLVKKIYEVITNEFGKYSFTISLNSFPDATYIISAKYKNDERISKLATMIVGKKTISRESDLAPLVGDCTLDKKINLVDFSILAYWYGRDNPPVCIDTNKDGTVNLVDFSILAYYWTG